MEVSLLQQSQIAGTQALKFQKQGLYDLAIESHLLAANLLTQIQENLPRENTLIGSLSHFIQYHQRQAELDEVILNFIKKLPTEPLKMNSNLLERSKTDLPLVPSSRRHQQEQRFRIFEEPDSLLPHSCSTPSTGKYTVKPKSDNEIIEEYKTMIQNLKSVILMQAEELTAARNKTLKDAETIQELKRRLEKYESMSSSSCYVPASLPELPPLEPPPDCDFKM